MTRAGWRRLIDAVILAGLFWLLVVIILLAWFNMPSQEPAQPSPLDLIEETTAVWD